MNGSEDKFKFILSLTLGPSYKGHRRSKHKFKIRYEDGRN